MSRNEYDLAVGSWAEDAAVSEPSSLSRHRAWPANHLEILRKARPRAPFKGKSIQRCNLCPRVVLNPSIRNLQSTTYSMLRRREGEPVAKRNELRFLRQQDGLAPAPAQIEAEDRAGERADEPQVRAQDSEKDPAYESAHEGKDCHPHHDPPQPHERRTHEREHDREPEHVLLPSDQEADPGEEHDQQEPESASRLGIDHGRLLRRARARISESAPLVYHERLIAWALHEALVVCQRVGERAVALARRVARGPQQEEAIASAERGIAPALVRAPPAAEVVAIAESRIQLDRRIDGDGGRDGADH